ncbi:hypothetical protein [Pseudomonas sp. ABFPK]|uniref:hypothetical protein n=1 Tax=Pseudomonas sp. ABFPK TaxID=1636605 RepID=UPI000778D116|nr:hypothetical protein [Pseudomonas sp. ABFPK]KYC14216.1 hypothetical protein WM94_27115 [Pseudomonas sp. ABFPK]
MSSIEVEPIDGPDEPVPVDQLAAVLTDSVGVPNDAGDGDMVPDDLATEIEQYDAHAGQRDAHLAEDGEGEQVDEQVEQQQPQGRKQHVPLGALQQERALHQQAKEQVRALQEQLAAHQAQMQQFQQWQQQLAAQQQQAQQQAEIPAFVDDPEGHINGLKAQFEQRLNDMQGQQNQRQMLEQAGQQVQRDAQEVAPFIGEMEPRFRAAHPDYDDAREFVQANIRGQLAVQYPGASAAQIQGLENVAIIGFLRQCQANGVDPCAHVYQRAQALGYQTRSRAPATPPRRAPTSLGALPGGGRAPDEQGRLSASQVASMSNEDFDRLFEQMRANDAPRFGF